MTWFRPRSTLPSTTTPPPQPVPRITPNTVPWPAPAPSVASDRAKQLASFSTRTSRPSNALMSRSNAWPFSAIELAFFTSAGGGADHAGDADADRCGDAELRLGVAHQAGDAFERGLIAVRRVDPMPQLLAAVGRQHHDLDLGAAEVDADAVPIHAPILTRCGRRVAGLAKRLIHSLLSDA